MALLMPIPTKPLEQNHESKTQNIEEEPTLKRKISARSKCPAPSVPQCKTELLPRRDSSISVVESLSLVHRQQSSYSIPTSHLRHTLLGTNITLK
ncbi:hypothetical protein M8J77_006924 [Diaphorina citri]|nr:hypothetical protein M8J77_006924 [Diaphorina citri]